MAQYDQVDFQLLRGSYDQIAGMPRSLRASGGDASLSQPDQRLFKQSAIFFGLIDQTRMAGGSSHYCCAWRFSLLYRKYVNLGVQQDTQPSAAAERASAGGCAVITN